MPQLLPQLPQISEAIDKALEKTGALPPRSQTIKALEDAGITIEQLATQLANLIYTAKDPTKLKAILAAFSAHGVVLEKQEAVNSSPTFIFNIQGESVNLQQLFAPNRKLLSEPEDTV